MDKKQFIDMMGNPAKFSSQDRGWLRAVQDRYPYSSDISVLALLADHAHGFDTPEQHRAARLAMCDNSRLDAMLDRAASANEAPVFDIFNEINQAIDNGEYTLVELPVDCNLNEIADLLDSDNTMLVLALNKGVTKRKQFTQATQNIEPDNHIAII